MARPTGRPPKISPDVQRRIVEMLELGSTLRLAAQYGGISYQTFKRYRERGERARTGEYRAFWLATEEAIAKGAYRNLGRINLSASRQAPCPHCGGLVPMPGEWKAAAWILERRHWEDFGRKDSTRLQLESYIGRDELTALLDDLAAEIVASVDACRIEGTARDELLTALSNGWLGVLALRYPEVAQQLGAGSGRRNGRHGRQLPAAPDPNEVTPDG